MCSGVGGFGSGNLFLNAELFKQGCGYHGVREAFSRFCHRHSEVVVECNIGLEALLQQGMSESIFCGDLVCRFGRVVGGPDFSDQFRKINRRYIKVGYGLCCGLRALFWARSRFMVMDSSLIAQRWVRPQTL